MNGILTFILFSISTLLFSQTQTYDVLLVGSDVGDMTITRSISGTKKHYSLQSSTSVMFGSRVDKYTCTMEFDNNVLVKSTVENRKNGKLIWFTYVNKVGDAGYKVQTEKGLSTIAGAVSYCCYDIFFKEPKEGESVFSERWGKFGKISKTEEHVYKLVVPDAEDYTYNYENGKMTKMEVPTFLGKCKFVMK